MLAPRPPPMLNTPTAQDDAYLHAGAATNNLPPPPLNDYSTPPTANYPPPSSCLPPDNYPPQSNYPPPNYPPPSYSALSDHLPPNNYPVPSNELVSGTRPVADTFTPEKPSVSLHQPVLIPQRRPGAKERGFVRAYAPCLEQYGVNQEAFLKFLTDCDAALQGSAAVQAVRVAASLVQFVPDPSGISNAVGAGLGLAAAAAAVLQSTWKTNTFIDEHNEKIFLPRGLFCVIVTHDPTETDPTEVEKQRKKALKEQEKKEKKQRKREEKGKKESPTSLTPQLGTPEWMNNLKDPYRKSQNGLPLDVAPLTFHEDDLPSEGATEAPKKSGFKKLMSNMDNYLDNRALAQYAQNNGDDAILKSQPKRAQFSNRYLDPTHPATNGGLAGLLSGGKVTDKGLDAGLGALCPNRIIARQLQSVANKSSKGAQNTLNDTEDETAREKARLEHERTLGTQLAGLSWAQEAANKKHKSHKKDSKAFKKGILYLTVVDLAAVSDFTNRRGDCDDSGEGASEGFGEVIGTLMENMADGIVVI